MPVSHAAVQTHTFHIEGDEDWARSPCQPKMWVNVVYRIDTVNKGWDVDTVITLYDNNGNQISGSLRLVGWNLLVPQTAGKYYV